MSSASSASAASGTASDVGLPAIESGVCHVLFAYDVGRAIDLDRAERLITATKQRETIRHRRRAPASFQYQPPPLRITKQATATPIAGFATDGTVDAILYDFGAMSIAYAIPLSGPFEGLLPLSQALYDNAALLADSRRCVEDVLAAIGPAVDRPSISGFVEDYVIFEVAALSPAAAPSDLIARHGGAVARILRSETQPLSEQEIGDALACRLAFGAGDATVIDWAAALLLDPGAEDVRTVLEFANVELLEMRYLDHQLDAALDEAYRVLSRRNWGARGLAGSYAADLRRVSQLEVDAAVLFEAVNNALKLLGDQYLARAYRLVSQRFHLAEWDAAILRKLHTLESIYTKLVDRQTTVRMEVLEWIIIVLIAVSILLPFIPGMPKH